MFIDWKKSVIYWMGVGGAAVDDEVEPGAERS